MTNITYLQSLFLTCITLLSLFPKVSISVSTLFPNQSLTDNQTLVSEGQHFELGFFSPGYTKNRYLGIWYKNISPLVVVWVANRNIPLTNASGVLKMDENGNLVLLNHEKWVVWSSNQSHIRSPIAEKLVAKLLDSGNLVVTKEREDDHQTSYQWESFCHVTDTLLQGMKLGWDTETGVNNSLTSWKTVEDPSKGDYSLVASPYGSPEIYLLQDQTPIYRSGPWNGIMFSGIPHLRSGDGFMINMVLNKNQNYYSFEVDESIISRVVVDETGKLKKFVWLGDEHGWTPYWDVPIDRCDTYKECGPYGVCSIDNSPVCNCLRGFEPRYEREWKLTDGSGGCVRKTKFECARDDGFLKLTRMKLPDCSRTYYNQSINLKECKEMCLKNCSCTAYANSDVRNGGGGCIMWIGDLFDLKQFPNGGQDLYVRVATSELEKSNQLMAIIITATAVSITLLLGLIICFIRKKRTLKRTEKDKASRMKSQELALIDMFSSEEHKNDDLELPLIDFDTVSATTENFSEANKIGEGGFGSVYKGTLANGQQVAVKRLSKDSGQGVDEFKNEVTLIAKLQHRNLVRLLGCCIYGEEKLLIYEYMPNKSLDFLLFDKTKSMTLDWEKRFNIIVGIARGLLYLHQDSRFRIIHRDLKASNVLLDDEMDPKISDFGMARIFGSHQTEANTCRVVGTYGYMSPEYAMDGIYSAKSDVFSYGVLVLEIISGKKNRGFHSSSTVLNLLGYAWKLWEEDKSLEIMDESLSDICSIYEVLKCIQIGLLCVQEVAEDRPSMSSVVLMLGSETATLAQPKQPGFSFGRIPTETYSSSNDQETGSVDYATVTMVDSR